MKDSFSSLPSGIPIGFTEASIARGPFQHSLFLWVKGPCPGEGRSVRLAPRIYPATPDYWAIEVLSVRASDSGADRCHCEEGVFACSLPLSGLLGTRGVRIVGLDRSVDIDVARG